MKDWAAVRKFLEISVNNQKNDVTDISPDDLKKFYALMPTLSKEDMNRYKNIPAFLQCNYFQITTAEEAFARVIEQVFKPLAADDQKMTYIQASTTYLCVTMIYARNHQDKPSATPNLGSLYQLSVIEKAHEGLKKDCPNLKKLYGYDVDTLAIGAGKIMKLAPELLQEHAFPFAELLNVKIG